MNITLTPTEHCHRRLCTKDPVPQECRKGMVYKVQCSSCDMSYIGETGQTLQLRMKEHKRALANGDPWLSTLAERAMNHQHDIAWKDATVADADPHMY